MPRACRTFSRADLPQHALPESLTNSAKHQDGPIERKKRKIDTAIGRHIYSQRLGIVEAVFGNIGETLGLRRISLRGKSKVNGPWPSYDHGAKHFQDSSVWMGVVGGEATESR